MTRTRKKSKKRGALIPKTNNLSGLENIPSVGEKVMVRGGGRMLCTGYSEGIVKLLSRVNDNLIHEYTAHSKAIKREGKVYRLGELGFKGYRFEQGESYANRDRTLRSAKL
jgi:hypothetical protein